MFTTESGLTRNQLYPPFENSKIWPCFGVSEDPVRRWHELVASYTGLHLTYANDRLPAIAAIVEREMRLRPGDTYIAGMWRSSLLTDLGWQRDYYAFDYPDARLKDYVPTWAWPSSKARIIWYIGKLEQSLRLVGLFFRRIGPAHVGQVLDASIILEGPTYMARRKDVCPSRYNGLRPSIELISPVPAYRGSKERFHLMWEDFDWRTGDRPVTTGDTLLIMPIKFFGGCMNPYSLGLILHEVADGDFERIGVLKLKLGMYGGIEVERLLRDFIDALPIRQVKII